MKFTRHSVVSFEISECTGVPAHLRFKAIKFKNELQYDVTGNYYVTVAGATKEEVIQKMGILFPSATLVN